MGWKDLLQKKDETVITPWFGGRNVRLSSRRWKILGTLPGEHGWYAWRVEGRKVSLLAEEDAQAYDREPRLGYLLGDLFVPDGEGGEIKNPAEVRSRFERVRLVESGIDHFTRVKVDRLWDDGPLIFMQEEFPLGPEDEVRDRFLDQKESVQDVSGVVPALDLVFRMATWHRKDVEARRAAERLRMEEEERQHAAAEERRRLYGKLGDGAGRRELAKVDFPTAAKSALAVGGAEFIDHRSGRNSHEHVVRYKLEGDRYECVVSDDLRVIDSGICLTDEGTGERGDTYFTLESLPGVVLQAVREHRLVVYRRA